MTIFERFGACESCDTETVVKLIHATDGPPWYLYLCATCQPEPRADGLCWCQAPSDAPLFTAQPAAPTVQT